MKITTELIEKYHAGECSDAEKQAIETWLKTGEGDTSFLPEDDDLPFTEKRIWDSFPEEIKNRKKNRGKIFIFGLSGIAAALLISIAVRQLYTLRNNNAASANGTIARTNEMPAVFKTTRGQKMTVQLPDGTQVILNNESELRYFPKQYAAARTISFSGEALFTVQHDAAHPFVIQTDRTTVTDLGTEFDLQAYRKDNNTAVTVLSGSVNFSDGKDSIVLHADEKAVLNSNGNLLHNHVYAKKYIRWKDNVLDFDNKTLAAVATDLERWYDMHVTVISDDLKRQLFTGTFNNTSLQETLRQICFVVKCNYSVKGNQVILYP